MILNAKKHCLSTSWSQWRRQLVGTWARAPPPWRLREFFSLGYTLKHVVWFGLVLCQTEL